jgi:HD superfamily phosphohydrolase
VIGYDRIIKMLVVHNGELMVEEKAIYSIEKFLVARRLMYWQVYLHKTVLSAEMMLVKILERVKELSQEGDETMMTNGPLTLFLSGRVSPDMVENLELFTSLDDTDVVASLKAWCNHPDKLLSFLCNAVLNRRLFKVRLQAEPISPAMLQEKKILSAEKAGINIDESDYLAFTGEAVNRLYDPYDEHINILFKDGSIRNISQVDNALIHENLSRPVKKFYICYVG